LIVITTLFTSNCALCSGPVKKGEKVLWDKTNHKVYHPKCLGESQPEIESRRLLYDPATETFFLVFTYETYLITLIKQIGGFEWNPDLKLWYIQNPSPISAKQLLDLAELQNFEYDAPALFKLTSLITEGTQTLLQSKATTSSFQIQGLKQTPYPFQVSGIEFGIQRKRVIIADQMGLGKTIQAMGILAHLQLLPALIVCPAIIKLNWQREILAWIEGISQENIHTIQGRTPYILPLSDIYIINYDILESWVKPLISLHLRAVIYDEIHYAKTSTSRRGKAARNLAKGIEYVVGLTGTPLLSRPNELINPLRIIRRLEEIGGKEYYERRYCAAGLDGFGRWNVSGASNLGELNDRLRTTGILIRRLKKDVLKDLPAKLPPTIIPIELTNRKDYERAEKDLARWLGERAVEDDEYKASIAHLSVLSQLKAISARKASVEFLAQRNEERTKFIYLKRLSTEGKFHGIKEHVNNFLQTGEKLVIFGWFQDTQKELSSEWPHAVHALGMDSADKRNEAIDRFQNDPECKLLIASLKVLGIGVTLTAAHHIAFAELGWTPADHDQAEDRLHRIGQKFPVNVYYYIGLDTIEEDIIEIIDTKRKIVSAATDGIASTHVDVINVLIGRLLKKYDKRIQTR
jgi:SWI/SNF-related matrix-associated actin-dependent regulator 1 of chromatin subfamily A